MSDEQRRVIAVSPDQVLGPTRRGKPRPLPRPTLAEVVFGEKFPPPDYRDIMGSQNPQLGFGHLDAIARRAKR